MQNKIKLTNVHFTVKLNCVEHKKITIYKLNIIDEENLNLLLLYMIIMIHLLFLQKNDPVKCI